MTWTCHKRHNSEMIHKTDLDLLELAVRNTVASAMSVARRMRQGEGCEEPERLAQLMAIAQRITTSATMELASGSDEIPPL